MTNTIRFMGDMSRINEEEKGFINSRLEKFVDQHGARFTEMLVNIDIDLHKETSRGRAMHHIKLFVETDKGKFHSDGMEFGAEKSLHSAIEKVERQMEKHFNR
ncbi:MAG: hypothetical protein Q7S65_03820 [Nanoarchaeota archaeon]|nr:hypothetical protein [Nanoarchaeota archaeon]